MFENLTQKLENTIRSISGKNKISEINISEALKEVRKALVEADVSYKIAKSFIDEVKEKAIGQSVHLKVKPGELFIKIVRDELAKLIGGTQSEISLKGNPIIIMVVGLQGSGKTTLCSKLSLYLKTKKSKKPLLVACDIYRPAAVEQLKTLANNLEMSFYSEENSKDVIKISENAIKFANTNGNDVVIIDTAGRLAIDEPMMNELVRLKKNIKPSEILFVADSMTGQDALTTATLFNEKLDFDGVILTKMDSDARGGAAISIKSSINKPIKFIGTGEKPEDLEPFYPERIAERILGMGDILTLVERAEEQFSEADNRYFAKKVYKNQLSYEDLLKQFKMIGKMGKFKDIVGMIPGMSNKVRESSVDESQFKVIESIINSMTPDERKCKIELDNSRKLRIAKGSGRDIDEVSKLVKQHRNIQKMFRMAQNNPRAIQGIIQNINSGNTTFKI